MFVCFPQFISQNEDKRDCGAVLSHVKMKQEVIIYEPANRLLPDVESATTLILSFLDHRVERKLLVYGILL